MTFIQFLGAATAVIGGICTLIGIARRDAAGAVISAIICGLGVFAYFYFGGQLFPWKVR